MLIWPFTASSSLCSHFSLSLFFPLFLYFLSYSHFPHLKQERKADLCYFIWRKSKAISACSILTVLWNNQIFIILSGEEVVAYVHSHFSPTFSSLEVDYDKQCQTSIFLAMCQFPYTYFSVSITICSRKLRWPPSS